jgi:PEP-CTERM motif
MQRGLLLFLILLLHASSAHADPFPIRIAGGSLDVTADGLGHFGIFGFGDFQLHEVLVTETAFGFPCRPCEPGDHLNLGGQLAEEFGTARQAGVTYTIQSEAGLGSNFFAQGVAPAFGSSGALSVPFTYIGFFSPPGRQFELLGQGMATVRFRPDHGGASPLWDFDGARFTFATTPEPGTLVLLSSGIAVLAWRRRAGRRRDVC